MGRFQFITSYEKYIAELVGTFALSFVVLVAVTSGSTPIRCPLLRGYARTLVYSIGAISGCHINPSVTLGLLSIKKINIKTRWPTSWHIHRRIPCDRDCTLFGILAHKHHGNEPPSILCWNVGLNLLYVRHCLCGIWKGKRTNERPRGWQFTSFLVYSLPLFTGAAGILNPAVALALNFFTIAYIFAPILGALIASTL